MSVRYLPPCPCGGCHRLFMVRESDLSALIEAAREAIIDLRRVQSFLDDINDCKEELPTITKLRAAVVALSPTPGISPPGSVPPSSDSSTPSRGRPDEAPAPALPYSQGGPCDGKEVGLGCDCAHSERHGW